MLYTPTFHFDRQRASSHLKPTFTLSSSTCFFHVHFGLPFFLWPSTSKSNALLRTWPSSLLKTRPSSLINTWTHKHIFHSHLIYGYIQTQHEHQIRRYFPVFQLYSIHCSHHGSLLSSLFHSPCFTSINILSHLCCIYVTYVTPCCIAGFK